MLDMPYFMNEAEWFYFDFEKRKYVLTEKAPNEAQESLREYNEDLEREHFIH